MKCLFCGSEQSNVIDKRAVKGLGEIRRRRVCLKCHNRYTTYERIGSFDLFVIKRDGRKETFDRNKIKAGLERALEKRPALSELDALVEKIISSLRLDGKKFVDSKLIGKIALGELKKVDQVGYLRFISVYRHFDKPGDFAKELSCLK